jgi:hypothetical protein
MIVMGDSVLDVQDVSTRAIRINRRYFTDRECPVMVMGIDVSNARVAC